MRSLWSRGNVRPPNLGYTMTEAASRGQIVDIDFKTKTIRPQTRNTKAQKLEDELKDYKP